MSRRLLLWIMLALFLLAVAARLIPGPRTIDDAFITFRYARNLLSGEGFVFNPGERVLGTTTPLFTLILSFLGLFTGGPGAPFPWLALGLSALADGLSAVLLFDLGRRLGRLWAGLGAGLAWALAPFSVTFAIGGLETSTFVFLLVLSAWAYLTRRYILVGLVAALSLLTRPDALLFLLPLAFDRLFFDQKRRGRPLTFQELAAFLLPLLLWFSFAWSYFGNPLPHSLLAKAEAYRLEPLTALIRLLQHYATPFQGHSTFGQGWIRIGILLYPFLALLGSIRIIKQRRELWPLVAFPWLYLAAYAAANPLIFRWYLTPPLPFYFLLILIGLDTLIDDLSKVIKRTSQFPKVLLLLILPALLLLQNWTLQPDHGGDRPAPEMAFIELELLYAKAADQIMAAGADSDSVVAAGDVGVLGIRTQARILDLVGLNSPVTLGYYPLPDAAYTDFVYAASTDLILDQQPDFIVILEIYGRHTLLESDEFLSQYDLVGSLETDLYESRDMLIFQTKQ